MVISISDKDIFHTGWRGCVNGGGPWETQIKATNTQNSFIPENQSCSVFL